MERFRRRARKLRAAQASAEARLWQALRWRRLAHWKFRRQHTIDKYIVDFVTIEGKLIVEVDGVPPGSTNEVARDAARTELLEAFGYHVVRVTNVDVYENLGGVMDMIDQTLRPP